MSWVSMVVAFDRLFFLMPLSSFQKRQYYEAVFSGVVTDNNKWCIKEQLLAEWLEATR